MKKPFALLFALLFGASQAPEVLAAGEALQCVVTVKKVELKTASGDWKTAFEGSAPVDIAAPDSAAVFQNQSAPEGSYVGVRLLIDETFEVSGRDGKSATKAGGKVEIRGTAKELSELPGEIQTLEEKAPTHLEGEPGPMKVTLDYDYADRDNVMELSSTRDFNKAFSVKPGSKIAITLRGDLKETIVHVWPQYFGEFPSADAMIFKFPSSFSEFAIKVDGVSAYSGGQIDVKF